MDWDSIVRVGGGSCDISFSPEELSMEFVATWGEQKAENSEVIPDDCGELLKKIISKQSKKEAEISCHPASELKYVQSKSLLASFFLYMLTQLGIKPNVVHIKVLKMEYNWFQLGM